MRLLRTERKRRKETEEVDVYSHKYLHFTKPSIWRGLMLHGNPGNGKQNVPWRSTRKQPLLSLGNVTTSLRVWATGVVMEIYCSPSLAKRQGRRRYRGESSSSAWYQRLPRYTITTSLTPARTSSHHTKPHRGLSTGQNNLRDHVPNTSQRSSLHRRQQSPSHLVPPARSDTVPRECPLRTHHHTTPPKQPSTLLLFARLTNATNTNSSTSRHAQITSPTSRS